MDLLRCVMPRYGVRRSLLKLAVMRIKVVLSNIDNQAPSIFVILLNHGNVWFFLCCIPTSILPCFGINEFF